MNDEQCAIVTYRIGRANETLADAALLADNGPWSSCVNRLYYACFYAVSALPLRDGRESTKHTGIRSLFNQHYVRTAIITGEFGRLFNDLFQDRQEADSTDLVGFDESVRAKIGDTRRCIDRIEELIEGG